MREEFEKWFKIRYPEKKYQAVKEVMYDAFLSGAETGQRTLESAQHIVHADSVETCDCGEPFPESGYCKFCGVHQMSR